uniref:Secreted protein n=1 Tax=Arion vulgaris TaxID=1028688 RepID=A0A0B7B155_9EUPU
MHTILFMTTAHIILMTVHSKHTIYIPPLQHTHKPFMTQTVHIIIIMMKVAERHIHTSGYHDSRQQSIIMMSVIKKNILDVLE